MFLEDRHRSGDHYGSTAPASEPQSLAGPVSRRDALTTLEQGVVALSLFDHPSSIEPPRAFARFLGWISGTNPPNQLADRRLEALRRYCILLREADGRLASGEDERARTAGFSEGALRAAGRLVARGRCR